MTKRFAMTTDIDKEFYFYLGLLATLFSKMESNLLNMLGRMIVDNFVLTSTLLEKNSLHQNIELLKKINQYRKFQEPSIKKLLDKISGVKGKRNLFIHSVWGKPYEAENDIFINCTSAKILYEEKALDTDRESRKWSKTTVHKFRLSYIRKMVTEVEDIIYIQDKLFESLEEYEFD